MNVWVILISFLFTATASYSAAFKTETWETPQGTRVVFYQAMNIPMLDIYTAFRAGSAQDKQAYGLSALTTRLLNQGTKQHDASQLAEQLADTGAQYEAQSSRDMSVQHLRTLTDPLALDKAVNLFSLILTRPDFQQDAVNREKNQLLIALAQSQESPSEVAGNAFFKALYGNHPYAHPINGTKETLKTLNAWQVRQFYKQYFVASNAVMVLVGAIDSATAHTLAQRITADLPTGQRAPEVPRAAALTQAEQVSIAFPSTQTVLQLGQLGITHQDPDYFPLLVGNYILGGGTLVSRLGLEVREKQGLTYGISSQFLPMPGEGPFFISLTTKNDQANQALTLTEKTLTEFVKSGPNAEELAAAKQYLTGSFPLSLANNASIASMLLRIAFYNLPQDYLTTYTAHIEQVTLEDIRRAFDKHVHPQILLLIRLGKA